MSCLRKVIDHKRQLGCVCLKVKYGGWKTLERKWEEKLFGVCLIGWRERKINDGIRCFLSDLLKSFLPKMERKLKKKFRHHFWTKMPICSCPWACPRCLSSFFLFFLFLSSWLLPHLLFIYIFWFTEQASNSSVHILFFLLLSFVFFFFLFLFFF